MQNAKFRIYYYLCRLKKMYIPMELKMRLQRVLQIVEEAERTGALSDIERDILLAELREVYAELKFADHSEVAKVVEATSAQPQEPEVEESEEPEMEVEIIFHEEDDDEQDEPAVEDETVAEPTVAEPVVAEPVVEESAVEEPAVEESAVAVETPNASNASNASITPTTPTTPTTPIAQPTPTKRSALLSLYEDEPTPVLGEQFHEAPSVADTIACPKGVAESAPVASLREAIGVADKFMLIRELFDGDGDAYERAIENLEAQASLDDCIIYISENYNWRAQSEATQRVMELLQRKFNE